MEFILTLGLIVVAIVLRKHGVAISSWVSQAAHAKAGLEQARKMAEWAHSENLKLRGEVESLTQRVDELAAALTAQGGPRDVEPVHVAAVAQEAAVEPAAQTELTTAAMSEASPSAGEREDFTAAEPALKLDTAPEVAAQSTAVTGAEVATPPAAAAVDSPALSSEPQGDVAGDVRSENAFGTTEARVPWASENAAGAQTHATPAPSEPPNEPPPAFRWQFDWESLIGVRLFSWIAGLSLLLGAIFFLRYSAEHGWLNPTIRMAMGFVTGIAILVVCEWKGRDYRVTANALDAAGIGTLFATSFAANAVWHLVPTGVAFLLLVLVTAVAVLLSIRRDSLFIALLGLVGGFATPVLLSTGENHPVGLFGYLLLLNIGLCFVGYVRRWTILVVVSMALTVLYQWGWLAKFAWDDATQLPMAVAIFLLFPVVWFVMNRGLVRWKQVGVPSWAAEVVYWGSAMPLLLAVLIAWVPAFGQRYLLMFGYLLVLDVGLLALDYASRNDRLVKVAAVSTFVVWMGWLLRGYQSDAWPLVTLLLAVFVALFLGAQVLRSRAGVAASFSRFVAPGLLLALAIVTCVEPATASPFVVFGALLLLLAAIAAVAIGLRDGRLYYAAVPFVILAQACWSAEWLGPSRLLSGLVVYLAFALVLVLLPLLARRLSRALEPAGFAPLVAPLNLTLLFFLVFTGVAERALWIIGLLLIVLNVGAFIEAYNSRKHRTALTSVALSWAVLVVWWVNAIAPERLLSGLVVVIALVLLTVGGLLWLKSAREQNAPDKLMDSSPLLGLVGHLFLLFVATQSTLNSPPWTMLGIALVLDLALVAASLYMARALFAFAALLLTLLLLGIWVPAVGDGRTTIPSPDIAVNAALAIVALAIFLPVLARRRALNDSEFCRGRYVALLLAQGLFVELGALSVAPHWAALTLAQLLVLGSLLTITGLRGQHWLGLLGWALAWLGEISWAASHLGSSNWSALLALSAVTYALVTAYPAYCQRRATAQRWPFILALCGAASFFAEGYAALKHSPFAPMMGALPLLQSFITAGLLLYLLKIVEPTPPRDVGRLALVAAVALGFATTAIPLQLENEWLTIAWALEAAAVAWLYRRLRHPGLIAASLALAGAVTVRLVVNPQVLLYHARSALPLLNFYLYTYLVSAVAFYVASWYVARATEVKFAWLNRTSYLQRAFGTVLLFVLLNIEIADFYSEGQTITFRFSSTLAQDLTYTLAWALFAICMLLVGIVLRGRAARIAALLLLTVTIAKCFLHDLWRLGGLYRVGSFLGLALCLALVAILLQRFVLKSAPSGKKS